MYSIEMSDAFWIYQLYSCTAHLQIILDVTSDMAAVEVGGGPWFDTWKGTSTTPELLSRALRFPVDVDGFFDLVPIFKPPGL